MVLVSSLSDEHANSGGGAESLAVDTGFGSIWEAYCLTGIRKKSSAAVFSTVADLPTLAGAIHRETRWLISTVWAGN